MNRLDRWLKQRASATARPQAQPRSQTFILEPILTPGVSGEEAGLLLELSTPLPRVEAFDWHLPATHTDTHTDTPTVSQAESGNVATLLPEAPASAPELHSLEALGEEKVLYSLSNEGNLEPLPFLLDQPVRFETGVFTVGASGQISIDYLFDGGSYEGQLAMFSLEGMTQEPGSTAFIQEVARRALTDSELGHVVIRDQIDRAQFSGELGEADHNQGHLMGMKTFLMQSGDRVGFMLVPDGTVQSVWDDPAIEGAHRPLFSMGTANPNDEFQMGQLADLTGDGNTFVFEDQRVDGASDKDYNDLIFRVTGATTHTLTVESLIQHDWRTTDLGQVILESGKPIDSTENLGIFEPLPDAPRSAQPLIGIIDTGFSTDNADIDYDRLLFGRDRIDNDSNPLTPPTEIPIEMADPASIDTANEHGTHILGIVGATQNNGDGLDGINDEAPIWLGRAVGSGKWAESLVEFVDRFQATDQPNAVVNLSFDLVQVNRDGSIVPRTELTPQEFAALDYARQHGVLVVAAAGNGGGDLTALAQAGKQFDNLLVVGASEGLDRADYSNTGSELDLVAPGGTAGVGLVSTVGTGVGAMAGTSVSTAFVTGAASQVWAANPGLNYQQVIDILKQTARDLGTAGWDAATGAGLLNIGAAVAMAKVTTPALLSTQPVSTPPFNLLPSDQRPVAQERAVAYPITLANFTGRVKHPDWVNMRNSPNFNDRSNAEGLPYQSIQRFDAWTWGSVVNDYTTGKPDGLWFRVANRSEANRWVPSAFIAGYPPGNPSVLPPVNNTQPTQSGPAVTQKFAASGRGRLTDFANFRRLPWVHGSTLISQYQAGTNFTLLERVITTDSQYREWFRVRLDNGQEGYFFAGLVQQINNSTPAPATGLPSNAAQARPFFRYQFNAKAPPGNGNCGPASVAMVLAAIGLLPGGLSEQGSIDWASNLMQRSKPKESSNVEVENGIRRAGGVAEDLTGWDALDRALSQGKPFVSFGRVNESWRRQFSPPMTNGDVDHIIAVLGRTASGRYVVADPLYSPGPVEMSKQQLEIFLQRFGEPNGITASRR